MRSDLAVVRHTARDAVWYVVKDPSGLQHFRVDEYAYHFIGLLNGERSVEDAWNTCNETLGDDAPTQGEAIRVLGQLHVHNLLRTDLPPDTSAMLRRSTKRKNKEVVSQLTNVLFARIPLFDPDHVLDRLTPLLGWTFSRAGVAAWVATIAAGLIALALTDQSLIAGVSGVLSTDNLVWLYAALVLTKAAHEIGHGIACKALGRRESLPGNVNTVGVMLLVLVPVPYIDASSSSMFRSRWRRAWVGAAGMYYEAAIAAIAAIVWARSSPDSVVNAVAYNSMLIASVSTVLFNANPLIRFDGYYILADALELPNLYQRAREYWMHVVRRYAFGYTRSLSPATTGYESRAYAVYGLASAVYRVFLLLGIALFVSAELLFIGPLLGLLMVFKAVVMPIGKFVWYVLQAPEIARVRTRAIGVSLVTVAVVLCVATAVPVPDRAHAEGIVKARIDYEVTSPEDGFIRMVSPTGSVNGVLIVELENPALDARAERLYAMVRRLEAELSMASGTDRAVAEAVAAQLSSVRDEHRRVLKRRDSLSIRAMNTGTWVPRDTSGMVGRFVRRGELIGRIVDPSELTVRAVASQAVGPRLADHGGTRAWVRPTGRPDHQVEALVEEIHPASTRVLPSPALSLAAGGGTETDNEDPTGRRARSDIFIATLQLPDSTGYRPGQRAMVRFDLGNSSIATQGSRYLRQILQRRLGL